MFNSVVSFILVYNASDNMLFKHVLKIKFLICKYVCIISLKGQSEKITFPLPRDYGASK